MRDKSKKHVKKTKTPESAGSLLRSIFMDLLVEEKRQAGLRPDDLYYVGMANTAQWWWCGRKSILANREMELDFFVAHLSDRIEYSAKLGYVDEEVWEKFQSAALPADELRRILHGLPELRMEDIEQVLKMRERGGDCPKEPTPEEITQLLREMLREAAIAEGIRLELERAEKYSTIRWAFDWEDFKVVGVPDGITDEFVYEFKTTRNNFLLRFVKPVAFAQADLYGYFFKRLKKRVQILIRETGEVKTWVEPVSTDNAEATLRSLREAVRGSQAPRAPKPWKCRACEFREKCSTYFRG